MKKQLTTTMAAHLLGFSSDYVRRLCSKGVIKAQKLGHDWIMSESAIKNIKRKRKMKGEGNGKSK